MNSFSISGNIVDIINENIFPGTITVENGRIAAIDSEPEAKYDTCIMPGFIDAHVHIESSMMAPSEFARLASVHGTVAAVSDPHEIANVLGIDGVNFMIEDGRQTPFRFYFGAPSCVPATGFETSGATITVAGLESLMQSADIRYLSEMMNFPGVLFSDPDVMAKLQLARSSGRPIDGHAPGLRGDDLKKYAACGITTDHECTTLDEALEKIACGMKILIREGSAAKNFEALSGLIDSHPDMCMLCSDDKHPDDLVRGHINDLVRRSVAKGHRLFNVLKAAVLNPVRHYNLDTGLLRVGDPADIIVVNNLKDFRVLNTFTGGEHTAENGRPLINETVKSKPNHFSALPIAPEDIAVKRTKNGKIRVIEAIDGELLTNKLLLEPRVENGFIVSDTERDILKIVVINRYEPNRPSVGFIKNFGLKRGAIASSIAHDSHNIVSVGTSDNDICTAVNAVIESKGGIAVSLNGKTDILPLPVAGLMSSADGYETALKYAELSLEAGSLGSTLHAPFMTLSFMSLLVIPKLKLSDKGLFDGESFCFTELEV